MKKYVDLTKSQLDQLDKEHTILVSVLSPIEVHGSHLPLSTDVLIASEVKNRFISKMSHLSFLELPPLYTGAQPLPVPNSIGVRYKTLYNLLVDFGKDLKKAGFKTWVIFDNHGGYSHQLAELDAAKKLNKMGFNLLVPFIHIYQGMEHHDPDIKLDPSRDGSMLDAHAGTNETSLYMAIDNDFKDFDHPSYKPQKSSAGNLLRLLGSKEIGFTLDWINDKEHPCYIGDPSKATIEAGQTMYDYHVRKSEELLAAVLANQYVFPTLFNPVIRFLLRIIG